MKRSCHRQTTGSDSPERCIISMVPHPSLVATIIVLDVWGSAMNIRYQVDLNEEEKAELTAMLSGGKQAARKLKRAQILLAAGAGISDYAIARNISVSGSTMCRTKRRFMEGNLDLTLNEQARPS